MFVYDKTFDPKVVLGHCDLVSWFSDFALYLDTKLVYFHTSFRMTMTFDPNILTGHYDLISWVSDFALYLNTQWVYDHISFTL